VKIVIPGGTGHLGSLLARDLRERGHEIVVLSRQPATEPGVLLWDGRSLGAWVGVIDGADAIINLAGRSVNCRYNETNLKEMLDSRVDSTRAVGLAIERASRPPSVWLQMSTATIYAHRFDAANDEAMGRIGGDEPDAPTHWRSSIDIARAWEQSLAEARTQATRKVALRTAMVMSRYPGGPFDRLLGLTRCGLGGSIAGGRQYFSWIHERDFVRSIDFLLHREDMDGAVNVAAPIPLPQRAFMNELRRAARIPFGLPASRWMLELVAFFLRTESELVLKSRRVIPRRLLEAGFTFDFADWPYACGDLLARQRAEASARLHPAPQEVSK
jgi:uncharacterized protein (TIGR01777 family)